MKSRKERDTLIYEIGARAYDYVYFENYVETENRVSNLAFRADHRVVKWECNA